MNKQQRIQNRATARALRWAVTPCPECGMKGMEAQNHWIPVPIIPIQGSASKGFWTCPKFYTVTGRRDESMMPTLASHPDYTQKEFGI